MSNKQNDILVDTIEDFVDQRQFEEKTDEEIREELDFIINEQLG